jgi:hypothetical protein
LDGVEFVTYTLGDGAARDSLLDREAMMGRQAQRGQPAARGRGGQPAHGAASRVTDSAARDMGGIGLSLPPGHGTAASRANAVLDLQRTHGNQAVQRQLGRLRPVPTAPIGPIIRARPAPADARPAAGVLARTTGALVVQRTLLDDFGKSFPDSVALIKNSPEALKLVKEAETAGTKFGGFSEDGPGKLAWPYTVGDTVYVPKARTDKVVAMSDFLFELNNAIRSPALAEIHAEGAKGSKGKLTAKTYAYKKVEQEVEGMLRTGKVWFETKKTMGGGKELDKYDADFFLGEYNAFKAGKKTKDDIIKAVLASANPANNKTHEQMYMEQYAALSGGK